MWSYRRSSFILIFIAGCILLSFKAKAQSFERKVDSFVKELIRKKQETDTLFEVNQDEFLKGRYLGSLCVKRTKRYYIVCIVYEHNIQISRTAESHIFLYNQNKQYVGNYYLSTINQLPFRVENNNLWFKKPNNEIFKISFGKGIPKFIQLFGSNGSSDYVEFKS